MSDRNALYGISITVEPYDPRDSEPEAKWNARRHRRIRIEPTAPPASQAYTPDELLAAYRWFAGVVTRAALLRLRDNVEHMARVEEHHCQNEPWDGPCGDYYEDHMFDPRGALREGYPPWLGITVPTDKAEWWRRYFEQVVGKILAADQRSAPPRPEHHDDPHVGVVPLEATQQINKQGGVNQ